MRESTKRTFVAVTALCGFMSLAPGVLAQTTSDKAAAEALFSAGRDLMNAGKYADACTKFEASQKLDAGLGTLLFLADCYEKANRLSSAWATFREAESIAMGRSDQARAQVAKQRYSAIEPRLSKLWIKVADGNDPATQVKLDGESVPRESWGIALPTDAGDHTIEAMAPARKTWSTKIVVQGEAENVPVQVPVLDLAPITMNPVPASATTAPAGAVQDQGGESHAGNGQRTLAVVLGGVGVVGLGVGSYFGLHAKSKNDASKNDCQAADANQCSADGVSLRNSALSSARLSTAFMLGGGIFLVGGVVLYLTAPSNKSASGSVSGLKIGAGAAPGLARVAVEGAF